MTLGNRQLAVCGLALSGLVGYSNNISVYATGLPEAPETGSPQGNREGGGTRPTLSQRCLETPHPPTAITPESANGATTLEYPTFWFYIPYDANEIDSVEFSLLNQEETQTLYRTTVQPGIVPGVISVGIPQEQTNSLELNTSYRWYLTLNCQPKDPLEVSDFTLTGLILRTASDPQFRWNGVWYDVLNEVAFPYQAEPQNEALQLKWAELLESVGLEHLVSASLVD